MNKLKLGSLFDGIGGFPFAALQFGIEPVWASEIEPFPIKVTQHHFPNMKHLGDITKIDGSEIEPVDIITFGSPCQDLSVAGKRKGLGGERSGLFMDAVRIIRGMRDATDGKYPRFIVWENVPGAFSSNNGEDFRAVLEEIAESEIPMPRSGRWATAGMVRTRNCDLAWRCIDAQHWGVPQRRRRIFLVADFGGKSASEILFKPEGLRGNIAESGETGQTVAGDARDGVAESVYNWGEGDRLGGWIDRKDRIFAFQSDKKRSTAQEHIYHKPNGLADSLTQQKQHVIAQCVTTGPGRRCDAETETLIPVMVLADQGGQQMAVHNDISPTLRAQEHGHQPLVMREVSRTLRAEAGAPKHEADWESLVIEPRSQDGVCRIHRDGIVPTLNTAQGGQRQPCVCIQNATRGKSQNGLGISQDDVSYTLDSLGNYAVAVDCRNNCENTEVSATLQSGTNFGGYSLNKINPVRIGYKVRRLTPLECERLQGFPDYWTDIPGASDTARYKSIGNSVAIPCVKFILGRITDVF